MNCINKKILASCFLFLFLVAVVSNGCATLRDMPRSTQYTIAYEAMGIALETAKPVILGLCADGSFDEVECRDATEAYNTAVTSYKLLGDAVDSLILTGDETNVQKLLLTMQTLLGVVNTYLATQ